MGQRVLVVDDEKLIVKGIRFSLEQDGMEVDCAYDGEEALDRIRENEYDIILLDVMLPKLTGFEVCQQMREFSSVPVVMLTAMIWTKFWDWNTERMITSQSLLIFWKSRPGLRQLCAEPGKKRRRRKAAGWFTGENFIWTARAGG